MKPGEVFYHADEFNLSWHPTLRAMWSPVGQQVMIPTPAQPTRRYGLGAVNWHTGETVVLTRRRKRRREVAELLQALVDKHPHERIYVAWDNADTHDDEDVDAVVRAAALPVRAPLRQEGLDHRPEFVRHAGLHAQTLLTPHAAEKLPVTYKLSRGLDGRLKGGRQGRRLERRVGRRREKRSQGSLGCPNLDDHAREFQAATQWRRRYAQ